MRPSWAERERIVPEAERHSVRGEILPNLDLWRVRVREPELDGLTYRPVVHSPQRLHPHTERQPLPHDLIHEREHVEHEFEK